jgi:thiamine phosphate synthase YjbQ (UPF0047 family)
METLRVKTTRRTQLLDVTQAVERTVAQSGVVTGTCYVYVPNTYGEALICVTGRNGQ